MGSSNKYSPDLWIISRQLPSWMTECEGARASYVIRGGGCLPDQIAIWKCWNENTGGKNALDLLYLKTSLWSSYFSAIPKQPANTRQTLKDVSNRYESVFNFKP